MQRTQRVMRIKTKGYKKLQWLWISAFFASSRLCVGFYDTVIREYGVTYLEKDFPFTLCFSGGGANGLRIVKGVCRDRPDSLRERLT